MWFYPLSFFVGWIGFEPLSFKPMLWIEPPTMLILWGMEVYWCASIIECSFIQFWWFCCSKLSVILPTVILYCLSWIWTKDIENYTMILATYVLILWWKDSCFCNLSFEESITMIFWILKNVFMWFLDNILSLDILLFTNVICGLF